MGKGKKGKIQRNPQKQHETDIMQTTIEENTQNKENKPTV